MIYGYIGDCGSGKTLLMTIHAYRQFKEKTPVYANYKLNFDFNHLTSAFFRDYAKYPIFEACLCFDELSMYYSARRSASKQNLQLKPLILQTRKRTLTLGFSAQQLRLVDINIRENMDGCYFVEMYVQRKSRFILKPETWKHENGDTYLLKYDYFKKGSILPKTAYIPRAERYFNLYNTYEIISFDEEGKEEKKKKKNKGSGTSD